MSGLIQAGYLTSSVLCISTSGAFDSLDSSIDASSTGSISGLASQATARQGNILGMLGVGSGILASLAAVGFPVETLVQFAGVSALGGLAGTIIGRRITAIELPQMVAALHSVVGLAAVLTSIASVLADVGHASTLHLVTAYLGVLIGMSYAAGILDACRRRFYRRCHVHRIHSRFLQARWKDVLKTSGSAWSPYHQQRTFSDERSDHGGIRYVRTQCSCGGCRFPWGQRLAQLHQGFHYDSCYRRRRYA